MHKFAPGNVPSSRREMIIMRGVPGSGKSTLAQSLGRGGVIYSTDDFFMVGNEYRFDPSKIVANHAANQQRVREACEAGISPVVVDNTNTQKWEARPYVQMAEEYGYSVKFVEANTPWSKDAEECARRNTHGVPLAGIQAMLSRYEPHSSFTVPAVLASKAPWE
jgi:NEDD4-binding protein 2